MQESQVESTESNQAGIQMPITLTEKAIEMVKVALKEEGLDNNGLRIAVQGGGCSGLQYALDFTDSSRAGDSVFDIGDFKIYIDMASLNYLKGAIIDYVTGLNGTGFKFENPNAQRTCGCGHSFS